MSDYLLIVTEKQEKILKTALELFAKEGYHATSTSKIAKQAGVSEALIFRHFEHKEGLLNAIVQQVTEQTRQLFADIVLASEPKDVIKKALGLPFIIQPDAHEMWRLTYALKWQTNNYDASKVAPLKLVLNNAFKTLGYKDPEAETELVLMFIDGAASAILLHQPGNLKAVQKALLAKYKL